MGKMFKRAIVCFLVMTMVLSAFTPLMVSEVSASSTLVRIYGNTRYDTSIKVANELKKELGIAKFDAVILTRGDAYTDAFSANALSAEYNAPIILVEKSRLSATVGYVNSNLKEGGIIYILGGELAVPAIFDTAFAPNKNFTVTRLGGENRYDTNLLIMEEADRVHAEKNEGRINREILVCTGKKYPDALSSGSLGLPTLLIKDSLTEKQKEYLGKRGSSSITIIGGTLAVSESIENELKNYGEVNRVFGDTMYDTPVSIARKYFGNKPKEIVLVTGYNFPDGLVAGPLAYAKKCPIILECAFNIAPGYNYQIAAGRPATTILGGPSILSDKAAASSNLLKKGWNSYGGEYVYVNANGSINTSKVNESGFQHTPTAGGIVSEESRADVKRKIDSCSYGTAIVIHLEAQKLDYVKNGKLMLTTDVVTGHPKSPTPTGEYRINSGKARNVPLIGTNREGEPYNVKVAYWLPFIRGEYGIHDKSSQKKFGGTIYKTSGSMGCVRTPLGAMSKLYSMVAVGTKVVIKKK